MWQGAPGSRALLLGATSDPRAELWRWTLAPHDRYDAEPDRLLGFHWTKRHDAEHGEVYVVGIDPAPVLARVRMRAVRDRHVLR